MSETISLPDPAGAAAGVGVKVLNSSAKKIQLTFVLLKKFQVDLHQSLTLSVNQFSVGNPVPLKAQSEFVFRVPHLLV